MLDAAVVGGVIAEAQLFLRPVAQDQRDVVRLDSLDGGDLLGVDTTLEHGRRLGLLGQLGIGNLVAVAAETARLVDPKQEICVATPAPVEKGALVDDVGALPHRRNGRFVRRLERGQPVGGEGDLDHALPQVPQRVQVPCLVLQASPAQDLQLGIEPIRPRQLAARRGQLLLGEMLTLQEARQVARADHQPSFEILHSCPSGCSLEAAYDSCLSQPGRPWARWISPAAAPGRSARHLLRSGSNAAA